jgi:hypothetical protein
MSGTTGTALLLASLAVLGAGAYFFKTTQENRRLELQAKAKQTQLKIKEADVKAKEAAAREEEAKARQRDGERRIKEAEAAKAEADIAARRQEAEAARAKIEADKTAVARAEAEKAASDAARAKAEAEKAASDAARAAAERKAAAEGLAMKRAEAERAKAEAELARVAAAKKIAEAALAKSENEVKAAEANAAAERDRKLRMYRRAETSRAEMLALQRAERMLALEESGALSEADQEPDFDASGDSGARPDEATNVVVKVDWPADAASAPAADSVAVDAGRKMAAAANAEDGRRAREYIATFGALAGRADAEGRPVDAAYYRRTLTSLVPEYVDVYAELIDEARRKGGREKDEARYVTELMATIPAWRRVAVCESLLQRDEAYFSRALAGRMSRDEYVKAFRKLYDKAMRDKGDRDERRGNMARICKVLATYVPDYERSPEWR